MMDERIEPSPTATKEAAAAVPDEAALPPEVQHQGWRPPPKSAMTILAIVAIGVAAVLAILYAWQLPPFAGWSQDTDDAYVRGRVTVISPQVSGYITSVPVKDFQLVRRGQILATIDDRIYGARVEQAKANLAAQYASLANSQQSERSRQAALLGQGAGVVSAQAQAVRAEADMRRAQALVSDGSISAREFDQTRAALLAAQAAVRQAQAQQSVGEQDVRSVVVGRGGLQAGVENA
jgi:multidrug resistance efflux pump